jgi:flagellar biosynthesis protein FlhF
MVEVTAAASATSRSIVGGVSLSSEESSDRIATACMQKIESRIDSLDQKMASARRIENLEASVHDLKLLLLDVLKQKNQQSDHSLAPEASEVIRQLRHSGIDELLLARLASALAKSNPAPNQKTETATSGDKTTSENWYRDQAIRWMLKQITVAPRWDSLPGTQAVHCLVGPPGSGKSTLICKLAAQFSLREKSRVLLISYDNVRLAAAEQLRVYAKVMNISFESIQQPSDLPKAIARHTDASLILIDTTGRPARHGDASGGLSALKKSSPSIDFHLVLSATDKIQALDSAVRAYSGLGIRSLAFTRLDDSWQFADAFNIAAKWSVPLSFFGTGQEIPDAIERASRERIVEQVFGLSRA